MPSDFSQAIETVEKSFFLANGIPFSRLSQKELEKYKKKRPIKGWRVVIKLQNGDCEIFYLFVDNRFPFSQVHVAMPYLEDRYLDFPHTEENGYLCLRPEKEFIANPVDKFVKAYSEMINLIEANSKGELIEDFMNGFNSYWLRHLDSGMYVISLLDLSANDETAFFYRCWYKEDKINIIASKDIDIINFLKRTKGKNYQFEKYIVSIIDIIDNFYPRQYPQTGSDLFNLLKERLTSKKFLSVCKVINSAKKNEKYFLCKVHTKNGIALAGFQLIENTIRAFNAKAFYKNRGFRPYTISPLLLHRHKLKKINIERADFSWVYGRDSNPSALILKNKRVCIIGLGSVGSYVANSLAQAGVGELLLIDKEVLNYENVSRHYLGTDDVGKYKAEALANKMTAQYPFVSIKPKVNDFRDCFSIMKEYDLILSLIGEFSLQMSINNEFIKDKEFPDVLYGFLEERACVGHAILTKKGMGCFNCFFENGKFKYYISKVVKSNLVSLPSCGATFMPYGINEMLYSCSLISDIALSSLLGSIRTTSHKVFVCAKEIFESAQAVLDNRSVDYNGIFDLQVPCGCQCCKEVNKCIK